MTFPSPFGSAPGRRATESQRKAEPVYVGPTPSRAWYGGNDEARGLQQEHYDVQRGLEKGPEHILGYIGGSIQLS